MNDNDATTLSYARPDDASTTALSANSFVVWVKNSLVGTETASGFALNSALTAGDATLGRLGFDSTTTTRVDFSIDNLQVTDVVVVPEPSSAALLLGGGALLAWYWRRRFVA